MSDDKPVDLDAIQSDDELINAIGKGHTLGVSDPVVSMLVGWRMSVHSEPVRVMTAEQMAGLVRWRRRVRPGDTDVAAGDALERVMRRWRRRRWWVGVKQRLTGWWTR